MQPYEFTATQAAVLIASRQLSCEELTRSCLDRIRQRDGLVRAWLHVDSDAAIRAARERDNAPSQGLLRGVPIGFKDIIATAEMPTTYNSPLYAGHRPGVDANCVRVVRGTGGVVLGKTDTVEFASGRRKALTRNPHNLAHTPGASSSGSAAAVADFHVPLAFGTQTGASLIRPAAFNGIFAFKPTHGLVDYSGVRAVAPSLDSIGWCARSVPDLRLVAQAFRLPGSEEPAVATRPSRIGLLRGPFWSQAESEARTMLEASAARLAAAGFEIEEIKAPADFAALSAVAYRVIEWEARATLLADYLHFGEGLDHSFRNKFGHATGIAPAEMRRAYATIAANFAAVDLLFERRSIDTILTLSAAGEAPEGLEQTGSSMFSAFWTALGVPCLAVPVGVGPHNLPLGIQLIGRRFADMPLLDVGQAVADIIGRPPALPGTT